MKEKLIFAVKQFFAIRPKRDLSLSNRYVAYAAIAVLLTQLGDAASTWLGFQHGAKEGNGSMATIIEQFGFTGFFAVKLLGAGILVYLTWRRKYAPLVVSFVYTMIIVWNLSLANALSMASAAGC